MARAEFTWEEARKAWRKNVKTADGKYTTLRAPTKAELKAKVKAFENERDAGLINDSKLTVTDIASAWYPLASVELSYSGKETVRNAINVHICPLLGDTPVKDLKPAHVDELMLSMSKKSASLQSKVLTTLGRIMRYAVENGHATRNPCEGKKAKGKPAAEVVPLTASQQERLLDAAKDTRAYAFVALALYAGLRREEALGLVWSDVHLIGEYAFLEVTHVIRFEGQRPVRSEKLKTKSAKRRIPIPSELARILSSTERKSEFVVCDSKGNICSKQAFRNLWALVENRIIKGDPDNKHPYCPKVLDFEVNPHKLRHTYITNLCAKSADYGLDIKTIQYLAGHSSPVVTLKIYSHIVDERHADTADKVQKIFSVPVQNKVQEKTELENCAE